MRKFDWTDCPTANLTHLLDQVPYEDLTPEAPQLPPRPPIEDDYVRPPKDSQHLVPDVVP